MFQFLLFYYRMCNYFSHSVLRLVLTPKISKMMEILIFRSGWVVRIIPYAQFCPIPSPLLTIFSKNFFQA